jgi:hypothetical protein
MDRLQVARPWFRTVVSVGAATAAVYYVYKHYWSNCGRVEADEEREANSIVDRPDEEGNATGTAEALVDNDAGRDTMSRPLADECPICITEIRCGLLLLCGGACSPQHKQPENDFFPHICCLSLLGQRPRQCGALDQEAHHTNSTQVACHVGQIAAAGKIRCVLLSCLVFLSL